MKFFLCLVFATVSTLVAADDCTDACEPPACIPSGTTNPFTSGGNSTLEDTPQMILVIFEGSLNEATYNTYYKPVFSGVNNPNGCPITASFFFDHKYTDYTTVHKAWAAGYDAGVQSITGTIWNTGTSQDTINSEVAGEKYYLELYGQVSDVSGLRAPNGNSAGNTQFHAAVDAGLRYDVTLTSRRYSTPYWPYTLDCISTQDCTAGPCPTESFPGFYEFPVTDLVDGNGVICSNLGGCIYNNSMPNAYALLDANYQYRLPEATPFVVPVPLTWLYDLNNTNGLHQFLTDKVATDGAYVLAVSQALAWLQDPVGKAEAESFEPWQCDVPRPTECTQIVCTYVVSQETVNFNFCYSTNASFCPAEYPWVDNLPFLDERKRAVPLPLDVNRG